MLDEREDIRIISLDSFFLMMFLFIVLLAFNKTDYNTSDRNNNSPSTEISLIQSNATVCTGIQIQCYQKNWISNKDHFKLLPFEKTQFLDNKKVNQKIILLENIRKSSIRFPISFLQFHLFPHERDELPVLS